MNEPFSEQTVCFANTQSELNFLKKPKWVWKQKNFERDWKKLRRKPLTTRSSGSFFKSKRYNIKKTYNWYIIIFVIVSVKASKQKIYDVSLIDRIDNKDKIFKDYMISTERRREDSEKINDYNYWFEYCFQCKN